jgi:putative glycosyltransferase (TIGR04372 family)
MSRWALMKHDMSRYVLKLDATQEIYRINAAWAGRAPLLALSADDRAWSDERFAELGLPRGAWFACVHVREAGFSPADEAAHAHRNADPRALRPAMEEIVRRGGWCLRMGDPSMTRLEPMPGLIDYAHHALRSPRLDVLLCARARFFLGNTSGLALVSSAFGVPSALANVIPLPALPPLAVDLSIPKLLRSARDGRLLRFAEVLGPPAHDFRYASLYADAGLEVIDNAPDEIAALVAEMLDRIEGRHVPVPGDEELQRRFMALLRPGHYGHGAASRLGAAFLRKYAQLL